MSLRVALVYITWNRVEYARLSLGRLLSDPSEQFELYVWDNGSTDGTAEFLRNEVRDPRIVELHCAPQNVGQGPPMHHAWKSTSAELVGKVDDDCLVTPGWTRTFAQAHADVPTLGGVGCWHFRPDDFDERRAAHKIKNLAQHRLVTHPYLDGSAFLVKRDDYLRCETSPSQCTKFWFEISRLGRVNGWYYPLVLQDHMDDPRSPHFKMRTRTGTTRDNFGLRDVEAYDRWLRRDARAILNAPSDLRYYTGWRAWVRRFPSRVGRVLQRLSPVQRRGSGGR